MIQTGVTTTTDYLGGFQYKNAVLQFFPHAEGYVNATQTENGRSYTFNYVYNYTDHLGNIRLSYSLDPSTNVLKIIEENHYYPFGLKHTGYNSDQMMYVKEEYIVKIKPKPPLFVSSYDKKFNGKSWETDLSLNIYDFHARGYMPDIVRTFQQDPKAEEMRRWSPYSFFFNNPMRFVDPDGMKPVDWINWTGKSGTQHITYHEGVKTKAQAEALGYGNVKNVFAKATGHTDSTGEKFNFQQGGKFSVNGGKTMDVADGGYTTQSGAYINKGKTGNEQVQAIGSALQDGGDSVALAGYGLTTTVIGAPIGIPMVAIGNIISGTGAVVETGAVIHEAVNNSGSADKAIENIAVFAAGKVINHTIGKAGVGGIGEEILTQGAGLKLTGAQRLYDSKKEEQK